MHTSLCTYCTEYLYLPVTAKASYSTSTSTCNRPCRLPFHAVSPSSILSILPHRSCAPNCPGTNLIGYLVELGTSLSRFSIFPGDQRIGKRTQDTKLFTFSTDPSLYSSGRPSLSPYTSIACSILSRALHLGTSSHSFSLPICHLPSCVTNPPRSSSITARRSPTWLDD